MWLSTQLLHHTQGLGAALGVLEHPAQSPNSCFPGAIGLWSEEGPRAVGTMTEFPAALGSSHLLFCVVLFYCLCCCYIPPHNHLEMPMSVLPLVGSLTETQGQSQNPNFYAF